MNKEATVNKTYPMTFDAIKIGLASPEKIHVSGPGRGEEAGDHQLQNVKAGKGMVCSVKSIFGPSKDWGAIVVNTRKSAYKGVVCDRCGVEITKSSVRSERMGHIELAAPVSHIWYFKGNSVPHGTDSGPLSENSGEGIVFCIIHCTGCR